MNLHKDKNVTIYFGDAQSCTVSHKSGAFKDYCLELVKTYNLDQLMFQRQTHGIQGMYIGRPHGSRCPTGSSPRAASHQDKLTREHTPFVVRSEQSECLESMDGEYAVVLFQTEGDFLATDQKNVGVGVLTADCLPIVLYDQKNNTVAVIHAGWRGSVENIIAKTVETMLAQHYFAPSDLLAYFGPSAKTCCYEIQNDLLEQHKGNRILEQAAQTRAGKLFLDVPAINHAQLIDLGVPPCNINTTYNCCTMCNQHFHSYRNHGETSMRQPTIAWLS